MENNIDTIFKEYKLYTEQKEKFIDRNFMTNRFYCVVFIALIFALIYTNNVVFMGKITATLLFSVVGILVCALWWMNVDSYNTLIKIKFANVIEQLEEKLPAKPYTEEFKGIKEFKDKKVFMFSDIQKFISVVGALFFFAVMVSELSPIIVSALNMVKNGL